MTKDIHKNLSEKGACAWVPVVKEVDILRHGEGDDLLNGGLRSELLEEIAQGLWDVVIAAPPCNTYTRLLFANRHGPPPLRDRFSIGLQGHLCGAEVEGHSGQLPHGLHHRGL